MAEVLEGSGEREVVGLRGWGQDVVHPLRSLYGGGKGGQGRKQCDVVSVQSVKQMSYTPGVFTGGKKGRQIERARWCGDRRLRLVEVEVGVKVLEVFSFWGNNNNIKVFLVFCVMALKLGACRGYRPTAAGAWMTRGKIWRDTKPNKRDLCQEYKQTRACCCF